MRTQNPHTSLRNTRIARRALSCKGQQLRSFRLLRNSIFSENLLGRLFVFFGCVKVFSALFQLASILHRRSTTVHLQSLGTLISLDISISTLNRRNETRARIGTNLQAQRPAETSGFFSATPSDVKVRARISKVGLARDSLWHGGFIKLSHEGPRQRWEAGAWALPQGGVGWGRSFFHLPLFHLALPLLVSPPGDASLGHCRGGSPGEEEASAVKLGATGRQCYT